jgi:hypothetical protein
MLQQQVHFLTTVLMIVDALLVIAAQKKRTYINILINGWEGWEEGIV